MTIKPTNVLKKIGKKPKSSQEDLKNRKLKADHKRSVRSVFRYTGFERVPEIAEKDIEFLLQKGEFDDCFICENLIVLVEYTTSASNKISDHLKHKKIIFDKVSENYKESLPI